jgi:hypothetical protein
MARSIYGERLATFHVGRIARRRPLINAIRALLRLLPLIPAFSPREKENI